MLEPDELFKDCSPQRIVDNEGDPDSLLFGCLGLDDRDHLQGWGVSAARKEELTATGEWNVFVDDYDGFQYVRSQEDRQSRAEGAVANYETQVCRVEQKLKELRDEAREMLSEYGSVEPGTLSKGMYLAQRLKELKEAIRFHQSEKDSAQDNLRHLEDNRGHDADQAQPDDGQYNLIHWNAVYRAGQELIDNLKWKLPMMENPDVARLLAQVQKKRSRRELTFEHYIHTVGILTGELYRRTGSKHYLKRRSKMADLWKNHQLGDRKNTAPYLQNQEVLFDPSERQYGETRISESEMVGAIDLRTVAHRITTRHNVDFEEALESLIAQ